MRRHIIGILALAFLASGLVLWFWPNLQADDTLELFSFRLGAVMAVWWLAYPDLRRLPAWLLAAVPILLIILARWPRFILLVIPVILILAILKPRFGQKKGPR